MAVRTLSLSLYLFDADQSVADTLGSVTATTACSGCVRFLLLLTAARWATDLVALFSPQIFLIGLMCIYLVASEWISETKSKGEVKLYPRTRVPKRATREGDDDVESGMSGHTARGDDTDAAGKDVHIERQTAIFHWEDLSLDIPVKGGTRRLLDGVDGWVKVRQLLFTYPGVRERLTSAHFVQPGTLTALMGVSGAGKTTLLDTLASRFTVGVITGNILVDGNPRDDSFQVRRLSRSSRAWRILLTRLAPQRKTGYVQQQDLHLETATVRYVDFSPFSALPRGRADSSPRLHSEALQFSALLRQPASTPREEKLAYVEEILVLLGMDKYADAVVGRLGEGLNVEERKRLSIGAPASFHLSPLSLSLSTVSESLACHSCRDGRQARAAPVPRRAVEWSRLADVLGHPRPPRDAQEQRPGHPLHQCVPLTCQERPRTGPDPVPRPLAVHQPSAMLFARFDRLLFLARGGRTIYFGEVGAESHVLRSYFERNGSDKFPPGVNPAEFMLEVIGAAPGSHSDIDWHQTWLDSPERQAVKDELRQLAANPKPVDKSKQDKWAYKEFAVPLTMQFWEVQKRVFQQYWRSPVYIYSKATLCTLVVRLLVAPPRLLACAVPLSDAIADNLYDTLQALFIGCRSPLAYALAVEGSV